jgi:hypothetical protein
VFRHLLRVSVFALPHLGLHEKCPDRFPCFGVSEELCACRRAGEGDELRDQVVMALIDLKFQPQMLNAFLAEAGIPVAAGQQLYKCETSKRIPK